MQFTQIQFNNYEMQSAIFLYNVYTHSEYDLAIYITHVFVTHITGSCTHIDVGEVKGKDTVHLASFPGSPIK